MAKLSSAVESATQTDVQEESQKVELDFPFNNKTQLSWTRQGFRLPDDVDYQERMFLGTIVPEKAKEVKRTITKMVRIIATDYESNEKKHVMKDFLYYYENWEGTNYLGEEIPPVTDHVEGWYYRQQKKPEPPVNGRPTGKFIRTGQQKIYYLPFNKKILDEIIDASDSDKDEIIYVVKNQQGRTFAPSGMQSYTYEQFANKSVPELINISAKNPGQV